MLDGGARRARRWSAPGRPRHETFEGLQLAAVRSGAGLSHRLRTLKRGIVGACSSNFEMSESAVQATSKIRSLLFKQLDERASSARRPASSWAD
eukprot:14011296-Alexandrium_andersonii.AAC.2